MKIFNTLKGLKGLLISVIVAAGFGAAIMVTPVVAQQAATFWQMLVKTELTIQPTTLTGPTPFFLESPTGATISQITSTGAFTRAATITNGSVPTITGCGTPGSQTGGSTTGSFTAGATSCTPVITPGFTAPNGWYCTATDLTTPADLFHQTAESTTTCTLTATVSAADVILFSAKAY